MHCSSQPLYSTLTNTCHLNKMLNSKISTALLFLNPNLHRYIQPLPPSYSSIKFKSTVLFLVNLHLWDMDPVTAPSSLHGERPLPAGEVEEEQQEKKPVLKIVKDKVKKLKNAITKKSRGHGDGDDHNQHGDLDEGDEGFVEDDEVIDGPEVHGAPMYETSAAGDGTGVKGLSSGGGEATKGPRDGSSVILEEFDENQAKPWTDPETGARVEQNRSLPNPGIEPNREQYESRATGAGTGANEISGVGEHDKGVGDGLRLTTEKFVGDLAPPNTEAERNSGIEQSRAYESPITSVRTAADYISGGAEGAEGVGSGLGMIKEANVEDLSAPRTESETNTGFEHSGGFPLYKSPATNAVTRGNESAKGTDGLGLVSKDFVEDPASPRNDDQASTIIERSQVHLSPTAGARSGLNEVSGGGEGEGAEGVSDGLGLVTMELVEDPTAPKTEAEMNKRTERSQGREEVEISPELSRSLETMTISAPNDRGETELSKGTNNSYTDMVSSAASRVYEMVADAGTAVVSKVKPDAGKDGEGEALGKQDKGISFKEYITEKLTPGEDEKALSELITEAGQKKKTNEAVETPQQERTVSDAGGKGVGIVEKIRETVTSFLGGGEGSPKSTRAESHRKETEDINDFQRRPPEAVSHEEGSSEELPSSYH